MTLPTGFIVTGQTCLTSTFYLSTSGGQTNTKLDTTNFYYTTGHGPSLVSLLKRQSC